MTGHFPDGILNDEDIQHLYADRTLLAASPFVQNQVQPASLDLRLGKAAWRVRASFLPGPGRNVRDRIDELALHEIDLGNGAVLETNCVYIVCLEESLNLPKGLSASTNPKSSTGRIDVFTRIITDGTHVFDQIPDGYSGPLYAEISPRTFPVLVRRGSRLAQIRFRSGNSVLNDEELRALHASQTLVASDTPHISGGVSLSIDLKGNDDGLIGYRAKRHTGLIDIDQEQACKVLDYWEPLYTREHASLILDPNEFYILASREAVHVPPNHAAEMVPFDPLVGEFRVHYAGFFDPGFGHSASGGAGARAVLEVRSHEVPFIVEHEQIIGHLIYERMAHQPQILYGQGIGSNYQGQLLKLSKHFQT